VTGNTVIDALLDLVDDNYQFEDELLNDDQASNPYDVRVRQVSR
jgi:UDP-N-acetylglucosamine 2-epimerase (non-hydrolysing)